MTFSVETPSDHGGSTAEDEDPRSNTTEKMYISPDGQTLFIQAPKGQKLPDDPWRETADGQGEFFLEPKDGERFEMIRTNGVLRIELPAKREPWEEKREEWEAGKKKRDIPRTPGPQVIIDSGECDVFPSDHGYYVEILGKTNLVETNGMRPNERARVKIDENNPNVFVNELEMGPYTYVQTFTGLTMNYIPKADVIGTVKVGTKKYNDYIEMNGYRLLKGSYSLVELRKVEGEDGFDRNRSESFVNLRPLRSEVAPAKPTPIPEQKASEERVIKDPVELFRSTRPFSPDVRPAPVLPSQPRLRFPIFHRPR